MQNNMADEEEEEEGVAAGEVVQVSLVYIHMYIHTTYEGAWFLVPTWHSLCLKKKKKRGLHSTRNNKTTNYRGGVGFGSNEALPPSQYIYICSTKNNNKNKEHGASQPPANLVGWWRVFPSFGLFLFLLTATPVRPLPLDENLSLSL